MDDHKVFVFWDGYSVQQTRALLSDGLAQLPRALRNQVAFDVLYEEPPLGKFGLDTGVVIAIISSSVALAASALNCIAQIVSARANRDQAIMEVTLKDGSSIKIPMSATEADIEKILGAAQSLTAITQVKVITQKRN
ncbi:MAG TPA: hypothetical protein VFR47_29675 [Anaerolineales bacterium]|nr:hypothetical protein [Anaerolineales bacterium]